MTRDCGPHAAQAALAARTVAEARAAQERLRACVRMEPPTPWPPRIVAGLDVAAPRGRAEVVAAAVAMDWVTLVVLAEAHAVVPVTFPYVPGFLAFRELPALDAALRRLRVRPDLVLCDGHGRAHPRRFGLACLAGLLWNRPTIGCAKSILVGELAAPLAPHRGARAPLVDGGETIGWAVRTRAGVRPVYVSVGHGIDDEHAIAAVLHLARTRLPEALRRADGRVRALARARYGSG